MKECVHLVITVSDHNSQEIIICYDKLRLTVLHYVRIKKRLKIIQNTVYTDLFDKFENANSTRTNPTFGKNVFFKTMVIVYYKYDIYA